MGSPVLGFFFFGCVAASIFIFVFTKSRTNYYRDVEQRFLATKDPFLNILYALILFSLFGYLVVDSFIIFVDTTFRIEGNFMSLVIFESHFPKESAWFYLLSELMPISWLYWALNKEVQIIKNLRNARTLLLLGELPSAEESRISTPSSVIESDKPATFAEVLQAMDSELKKALQDAETLKVELTATKLKVVNCQPQPRNLAEWRGGRARYGAQHRLRLAAPAQNSAAPYPPTLSPSIRKDPTLDPGTTHSKR